MRYFLGLLAAALLLLPAPASSQLKPAPGPNDLYARVVDVGGGLCVVIRAPGDAYAVYDAGHWENTHCAQAVKRIVGAGKTIDVMILTHSDADHIANVPQILDEHTVRLIVRAGEPRPAKKTWVGMNDAVAEAARQGASVINFHSWPLPFGTKIALGDANFTIVGGWSEWTKPGPTPSEKVNALSIVTRLEYKNRSILLTGDTVGRRKPDPDDACKDAEQEMVKNHDTGGPSLKSDVIIAPHHGGNNGSSACFIKAVSPRWVIFPSGHDHEHPTAGAAQRYIAHGVDKTRMFRTDRGDDEEGSFEWKEGSVNNCVDKPADDDVEIVIRQNGDVQVAYRQASGGC